MEVAVFDTGGLIRKLRGNLTQEEFASEMGVGRTTIIRYESNERTPDAEFLLKLYDMFGVDPTHVLTGRMPVPTLEHEEADLLDVWRRLSDADKSAYLRIGRALAEFRQPLK